MQNYRGGYYYERKVKQMAREKMLMLEEVAVLIGVSGKTINNWYMFKKQFPDNEYAQILPEFIQKGGRQTRYWKESDIAKLLMFERSIPTGRGGVMGAITQKYLKKKGEKHDKQTERLN